MPSYLHPGVYVEEIPSGSKPIEGVSTSVTAFVGTAFRGPVNEPTLIGSWSDYVAKFGDFTQSSGVKNESDAMALAVLAFYQNGGQAAYICNLKAISTAATLTLEDAGTDDVLSITAIGGGTWANSLLFRVEGNATASTFDLTIGVVADDDGNLVAIEKFAGVSMDETADNFVEKVINGSSSLITVEKQDDNLPADTGAGGISIVSGSESPATATDYLNFYNNILRKVRDISVMVLPGQTWPGNGHGNGFISNTISHCESTMSRVVIVDPENAELKDANAVSTMSLPTSTYSVLYYPWAKVSNPLFHPDSNPTAPTTIDIAPSAIAAGMWTKIDTKRGVWKAPAGVEARVNASGLAYDVEDLEQDFLNPLGVNCLRKLPNYGQVIWGARTLATKANPEWRYVPVRRTAIFVEQSIYGSIQWAVFEANDHPLWSSLKANIGSFMNGLFRAGAFQGATADEAYFVRCGLGDTMTQGDIDRGQVNIVVGFAPLKPAEFVILRIQQIVGQQ